MATKKKPIQVTANDDVLTETSSEAGLTVVCEDCGHETSGPNADSVRATHARHVAQTGHGA